MECDDVFFRHGCEVTRPRAIAPDALGLGLRIPHYDYIFEHWPEIDYFEVISENFLSDAMPPRRNLGRILARYPAVMHGVGLNLLGHEALDTSYLESLRLLADWIHPSFISDHLCWTRFQGMNHHDLLPAPFKADLVEFAAERAAQVQEYLGRPFAIENISSYVSFQDSAMPEWEFYTRVVRDSGCWFMLDINNIYVSSQNHGFDPVTYIEAIDFSRVLQVHVAGHDRRASDLIIDTHDRPVAAPVWDLYRKAWLIGGPFPTLLEWDDAIPPMPEALAELRTAAQVRS